MAPKGDLSTISSSPLAPIDTQLRQTHLAQGLWLYIDWGHKKRLTRRNDSLTITCYKGDNKCRPIGTISGLHISYMQSIGYRLTMLTHSRGDDDTICDHLGSLLLDNETIYRCLIESLRTMSR